MNEAKVKLIFNSLFILILLTETYKILTNKFENITCKYILDYLNV